MDSVLSLVDFLIVLFADSVLSWLISLLFFLWIVSYPWLISLLFFFVDSVLSWSRAPKLQEDLLGTKVKKVTLTLVIYIF